VSDFLLVLWTAGGMIKQVISRLQEGNEQLDVQDANSLADVRQHNVKDKLYNNYSIKWGRGQ